MGLYAIPRKVLLAVPTHLTTQVMVQHATENLPLMDISHSTISFSFLISFIICVLFGVSQQFHLTLLFAFRVLFAFSFLIAEHSIGICNGYSSDCGNYTSSGTGT